MTAYQTILKSLDTLNSVQTQKLRALIILHKCMKALTIADLDNLLDEVDDRMCKSCVVNKPFDLSDIIIEDN